jgi:predicted O-methyltransferase YrrM
MNKGWLDFFFSQPSLYPNRTGQGPYPAGPPGFGGRFGYDEHTDIETRNLGLGWLYYALARMYKVTTCVCIGSGRGFTPILIAKGMKDNGGGRLYFIDPSLDDDFWKQPNSVMNWFESFGVAEIILHYLVTTQEFTKSAVYRELQNVDLLFIDGCHLYENVKFDFEAFKDKVSEHGLIAFHDSISRSTNIRWQGPRKLLLEILSAGEYQAFDFKLGAGLTLLQRITFPQKPDYLVWSAQEWRDRNPADF